MTVFGPTCGNSLVCGGPVRRLTAGTTAIAQRGVHSKKSSPEHAWCVQHASFISSSIAPTVGSEQLAKVVGSGTSSSIAVVESIGIACHDAMWWLASGRTQALDLLVVGATAL